MTADRLMRDTTEHPLDPAPRRSRTGLKLAAAVALLAAIGIAVNGILDRDRNDKKLAEWTDAQAIPTVAVVRPQPETKAQPLVLPGDIDAWFEAPIYARVNGYLKMWYKDIGAHVKAGDLLADTPDLDQQLVQAKHDLDVAIANQKLAEVTAKRWKALLSSASVSQQSVDEKVADAAAQKAKVAAAQANVARLEALEGFKRIVAPFDGVVTARRTDIGALINAGSGTGPELFAVADLHQMRIYVRVPQSFSAQIRLGMKATLTLPQYPGQTFPATVLTTSNAINTKSRTVLVELVADNPDGKLWPGTFATVSFELPANTSVVQIPASALLFQSEGLQVAVLGADNRVEIRPVQVGRNFGTMVEVLSGVSASDRVIDSPPDSIVAGQLVHPEEENPAITRDTGEAPAKPQAGQAQPSQPAGAQ
jgi:RND family efflux transporter MFP subunit